MNPPAPAVPLEAGHAATAPTGQSIAWVGSRGGGTGRPVVRVSAEEDLRGRRGVGQLAVRDEQVEREPVRPALAHRRRLIRAYHPGTEQAGREPVRVLVVDDVGGVGEVDLVLAEVEGEEEDRIGPVAVDPVAGEERVVPVAVVEPRLGGHRVAADPLATGVHVLEVARRLVEADRRLQQVVVEAVDQVEEVGRRGVGVGGRVAARGVVVPGAAERGAAGLGEEAERERPVVAGVLLHLLLHAGDPRVRVGVVAAQLRAAVRAVDPGRVGAEVDGQRSVGLVWVVVVDERLVGEPGQRAPRERPPAARVDHDLVEV